MGGFRFGRKKEASPERASDAQGLAGDPASEIKTIFANPPANGATKPAGHPPTRQANAQNATSQAAKQATKQVGPGDQRPAWSVPLLELVSSQADQVRAVEKSMKRLTAKVDMIDAKTDDLLLAMATVLEQMQLQQHPVRQQQQTAPLEGLELDASARLDVAVKRLSRYQGGLPKSASRGASRTSSFTREPKRTLSFSLRRERKPNFEATPEKGETPPSRDADKPFATLATLRPCGFGLAAVDHLPPRGANPYREETPWARNREDSMSEKSGASYRSGAGSQSYPASEKSGGSRRSRGSAASFRSDGSRKGLRAGYASSSSSLPIGLPPHLSEAARKEASRRLSEKPRSRWSGQPSAAEDANERYSAQLQQTSSRGATNGGQVYGTQRGELARLERRAQGPATANVPTVVSLAAASAAGIDPASVEGAKVYAPKDGPSPYYARPLRDAYGQALKGDVLDKAAARKAQVQGRKIPTAGRKNA